jgi:hypothetical protein
VASSGARFAVPDEARPSVRCPGIRPIQAVPQAIPRKEAWPSRPRLGRDSRGRLSHKAGARGQLAPFQSPAAPGAPAPATYRNGKLGGTISIDCDFAPMETNPRRDHALEFTWEHRLERGAAEIFVPGRLFPPRFHSDDRGRGRDVPEGRGPAIARVPRPEGRDVPVRQTP